MGKLVRIEAARHFLRVALTKGLGYVGGAKQNHAILIYDAQAAEFVIAENLDLRDLLGYNRVAFVCRGRRVPIAGRVIFFLALLAAFLPDAFQNRLNRIFRERVIGSLDFLFVRQCLQEPIDFHFQGDDAFQQLLAVQVFFASGKPRRVEREVAYDYARRAKHAVRSPHVILRAEFLLH